MGIPESKSCCAEEPIAFRMSSVDSGGDSDADSSLDLILEIKS